MNNWLWEDVYFSLALILLDTRVGLKAYVYHEESCNNMILHISCIAITHLLQFYGASMAKWSAHLPFTCEVAGSSLSENFLNATRTQFSCEKSQRSAESRGFSPGTPVSSHRESWQGGLGKRAHSNWHMLLWWPCRSWQS
jgi:hypothetical protein